jgi:hypothetical protein
LIIERRVGVGGISDWNGETPATAFTCLIATHIVGIRFGSKERFPDADHHDC